MIRIAKHKFEKIEIRFSIKTKKLYISYKIPIAYKRYKVKNKLLKSRINPKENMELEEAVKYFFNHKEFNKAINRKVLRHLF